MTIEQIEYALAVAQHQSFVKAAETLHLSQPALTMQLKKLEDEIGIVLFDRSRKPLLVTREGIAFLEKAQEVRLSFRELNKVAQELKEAEDKELRLGVIPTVAPFLLPLFINHFRQTYLETRLLLYELITEEIIAEIREGRLHAGIVATPLQSKGIEYSPLFYEKFFLYISPYHPWYQQEAITPKEIADTDLWLLREGNCFRSQANDICQLKANRLRHKNFAFESTSIQSLMRIVEHQEGVTLVPELATLAVSPEQESMLKSISGRKSVREISLVYSRFHSKKKLLNSLQKSIQLHLPGHMLQTGDAEVINSFVKI